MEAWHVVDVEGNFVGDEDEEPIVFTDHEKAKALAKRKLGSVVPITIPAVPVELTDLERTHTEIVAAATKNVRSEHGALDPDLEDAHVAQAVIAQIIKRKESLRTVLLATIAEVSQRNLHVLLGYSTVKEFLQASGISTSDGNSWRLYTVGDTIFPWMQDNGYDLAKFMGGNKPAKLMKAVSALRRGIVDGEGDPHEVLKVVEDAPTADAVAAKLHTPKNSKGWGFSNGRIAVIRLTDGDMRWLKQVIGRKIEWDMIGTVEETNQGARIDVMW